MTNLFVVESPFQLLSAIEAKEHFASEPSFLILKYASERTHANSNAQLRALKDNSQWDTIIEIKPIVSTRESNIHLLLLLRNIKKQKYHFKRIFIGEYRQWSHRLFFDILNPQECFILDDGSIILELQSKYLPTGEYYTLSKGYKRIVEVLLQKIISGLFGLHTRNSRRDIHLFTCFDLVPHSDWQQVIKHSFSYFKILGEKKDILDSTIYFFGGNFSDLGLLKQDVEFELLKKVFDYYKIQNKKLVYLPHRRESQSKVEQIRNHIGIEILYFSKPAEIEFILMDHLPSGVASFCSTALYTVSRIYKFQSVEAFYIPMDQVPSEFKQDIISVYNEYKKIMTVIDLNETL